MVPPDYEHEVRRAEHALRAAERWLKVRSVSRRLDIHFRTVYRWIEEGRFAPHDVRKLPNGDWRIAEPAVERLFMAQSGTTCTRRNVSQTASS